MSKTLHIYGQAFEHQDAKIVGNLEALEALHGALGEVIQTKQDAITIGGDRIAMAELFSTRELLKEAEAVNDAVGIPQLKSRIQEIESALSKEAIYASDGEGYGIQIIVMPNDVYERESLAPFSPANGGNMFKVNKKWAENPPQYLAEVIRTAEDEIRGPARELLAALKKLVNLAPIHNYPESTILEAKLAIAHAEEIL